MNITPSLIYWITRLDYLIGLGCGMTFFGIGVGLLLFGPLCDDDISADNKPAIRKAQKWLLGIGTIGILLITFVPSKKDAAAMIVIPRVANSETVADIGDGVKTLVVEWLEELRPAAKNGETK